MADETGRWSYATTGGGWLAMESVDHGDRLQVRFAEGEGGRLVPVELRLEGKRPIDSTTLRRLPLASAESLANGPWRNSLRNPTGEPQPRVPRLAPMVDKRFLTDVPPGRKQDWFYKRLAAIYSQLAARSNRPAAEIAEANKVPVTTVHRWVKEARRRGFLPPGQKGRRG